MDPNMLLYLTSYASKIGFGSIRVNNGTELISLLRFFRNVASFMLAGKTEVDGDPAVVTEPASTNTVDGNTEGSEVTIDAEGSDVKIDELTVSNKEIAKGSNGAVVFEGSYGYRDVAVKRYGKAHFDDADREIQNLTKIDNHENIGRFYGHKCKGDYVYLALERGDCTLYDLIKDKRYRASFPLWRSNPRYPTNFLLKLMRDIIDGVVHMHTFGIVHGNLNTHNVLIVKEENCLRAKLSDLGNSKRRVGDSSSLGPPAIVFGTLDAQVVKQIYDEQHQMRAMEDNLSLGRVLYFCMTDGGDIPVINNNVDLSAVKHIHEAMELFPQLLNSDPKQRPKASEVQLHQLFWSSEKRMEFLRRASDTIKGMSKRLARYGPEVEKVGSIVLGTLESKCHVVFHDRWDTEMEGTHMVQMERRRRYKYNYSSLQHLLRIIRNTEHHYDEFPEALQKLLGSLPEGVDDYFRSRFPNLLMVVYEVLYPHCKDEDWFQKFLKP